MLLPTFAHFIFIVRFFYFLVIRRLVVVLVYLAISLSLSLSVVVIVVSLFVCRFACSRRHMRTGHTQWHPVDKLVQLYSSGSYIHLSSLFLLKNEING